MLGVKTLVACGALLFGGSEVFANSTAFSAPVQIGANTSVDFASMDSGNFRITLAGTGQLSFRYADGASFVTTQAASFTISATSESPWSDDGLPVKYTALLTV